MNGCGSAISVRRSSVSAASRAVARQAAPEGLSGSPTRAARRPRCAERRQPACASAVPSTRSAPGGQSAPHERTQLLGRRAFGIAANLQHLLRRALERRVHKDLAVAKDAGSDGIEERAAAKDGEARRELSILLPQLRAKLRRGSNGGWANGSAPPSAVIAALPPSPLSNRAD